MTLAPSTIELIQSAIALHPGVCSVQAEPDAKSLRVTVQTSSREWTLRIVPSPSGGFPDIALIEDPLVGSLAHVNYTGTVCVTDHEGLSIDFTRPAAVVTHALSQTLAELEKSLAHHRCGDRGALIQEFEGYWFSLPRSRAVETHLVADEQLREITACVDVNHECLAYTERHQLKAAVPYAGLRVIAPLNRERALYIPFATAQLPPTPAQPLSVQWVRERVFDAISAPTRAALEALLRSWPRRVSAAYLLLSQPRAGDGRALFSVQFTGKAQRHPLLEPASGWTLRPLFVRRHTALDLRPRGGASAGLASQHVGIVGCGAIGARIAEHLALSGVGRLTLIDPERWEPDNLYRHLLGGEASYQTKVAALKAHLERRLPDIRIDAEPKTLADWMKRDALESLDALVLAIGKPHIERAFVRQVWRGSDLRGAVVTTWLEPLGLGGHVQRTFFGLPGCLECLYTELDGRSSLAPRVAFAQPGQVTSRNLTGCVGAFTPYSALDASQTAILATRLVTASLAGELTSTYASWRGDDQAYLAAGFTTTPWFQSVREVDAGVAAGAYSRVPCPVCGGTR